MMLGLIFGNPLLDTLWLEVSQIISLFYLYLKRKFSPILPPSNSTKCGLIMLTVKDLSKALSIPVQGSPMFILRQKLKNVKTEIKEWNKSIFGNIQLRVENAMSVSFTTHC